MRVYDNERLHPAPVEVVAAAMGYKSANNGTALAMLASLRYFGLLERPRDGMLAVTKNVEMFRFSPSEEHKRSLLIQFLTTPPLYAELLAQYTNGLPSDAALKYELIQKGFLPAAAENAIQVFKLSVQFAGYYDNSKGDSAESVESTALEEPDKEETLNLTVSSLASAPIQPMGSPMIDRSSAIPTDSSLDQIPVRLPGGRRAWLLIPTPFFSADKVRLKAQIDLLLAEDE